MHQGPYLKKLNYCIKLNLLLHSLIRHNFKTSLSHHPHYFCSRPTLRQHLRLLTRITTHFHFLYSVELQQFHGKHSSVYVTLLHIYERIPLYLKKISHFVGTYKRDCYYNVNIPLSSSVCTTGLFVFR